MSLKTGFHRVALTMQALGVIWGVGGLIFAAVYSDRDPAIIGGMVAVVLLTAAWILKGFLAKDGV